MKEIEAKIKLNDLSIIKKAKLNLIKEIKVLDFYFDNELNEFKKEDKVLRLRKENEIVIITYKGKRENHNNLIVREEIETKISSFKKALLIINNLGFKEKIKVEKIRTYFSYDKFSNLIITLDKYPFIGNYLEIEGKENEVNLFLKEFNLKKTIQKNCTELFIDFIKENNLSNKINETNFTFDDENQFIKMNKLIKIGHRGAKSYMPENTIASFKKALELNVDAIELDVHLCKTNELVVIHDFTLKRTTNGKGFVKDKSLNELKKLDAGLGEKIPLLKEVLDLINKKVIVNIELKGKNTANEVNKIIKKYIKKGWNYNHFIVSSFNYLELKKIHNLNSKIKIGLLFERNILNFLKKAKEVNAYSINVNHKIVNKNLVKKIHENNLKIFVWTVNDKKNINKMKLLGVDGIFSDKPDLL